MTNINSVYLWVNFLADSYQSRKISDDEFNQIIDSVNLDLWKLKVGLPEEYQVNAPFARQAWQVSNKISDDMRFFITEAAITKNVSTGIFAYPADYGAFSSLRYRRVLNQPDCEAPTVATRTVELVTDAELSERLDNTVIPPDFEYPVGAWYATGWKVFPTLITSVNLTYLRLPTTPVRGYLLDPVTDLTTYNPLTSVQLDFPTTLHIDFAYLVLKQFAINIREEELYQYAAQRQNSGQ
jgi:hypothetical protein